MSLCPDFDVFTKQEEFWPTPQQNVLGSSNVAVASTIEDRIPPPAAEQVPIYSNKETLNAETIVNSNAVIRHIIIRRF